MITSVDCYGKLGINYQESLEINSERTAIKNHFPISKSQ
ncbi:hypothetical protein PTRA_a0428 [Pseudoalteromonas translucida KMM 520]|uniref:Uncharacterized protein n=1 Tax=Pseudoalteromonas translucida KMM 520 TaxID=1315283 RepID=A0A0U2WF06_9GAMM|nr:hypothetical protein PTRA_a0428 [Pseudoalteromonas translucida KMM 520]